MFLKPTNYKVGFTFFWIYGIILIQGGFWNMTLDSIFTLSLAIFLFITLVIITIFYSKRFGEEGAVPIFFLGLTLSLLIWSATIFAVFETDAFSSKSISWDEHNISKLEQKIENSDKEYDIIRYQTKIQKWEKDKEFYFNQIKENNKKAKE